MGIKTRARIFLGFVVGGVASAAFLVFALRFWDSIITPYPPSGTETRRAVILLVELGIYCAAGLVFGIVNSLFISGEGRDFQVILGASLALILLLPFTLIEGHFVRGMLIITFAISAACGFFIKLGQLIVLRSRKVDGRSL